VEGRNNIGSVVVIVSVEWKVGNEVTGECCCHWGVEGKISTGIEVVIISVGWKVGNEFTGAPWDVEGSYNTGSVRILKLLVGFA